jgi:hypothetical protein
MVIKSRMIRWMWYVVHIGEMRNAKKILVVKHEGKGSLGRQGGIVRVIG